MNKASLTYYFTILMTIVFACEDPYNPDVEDVKGTLTVEAQIVVGETDNYITLKESIGFNENGTQFPAVVGAQVFIVEDNGNGRELPEVAPGEFKVNFKLNDNKEYKLQIFHEGETYESIFESISEIPELDTLYGIPEVRPIISGTENSGNFITERGLRTHCDLIGNDSGLIQHYRFTATKILQNIWIENPGTEFEVIHFLWKTFGTTEKFNIAGPPEYSNSNAIEKHPLFFLKRNAVFEDRNSFAGWIMVLKQYTISKAAYDFYKDLNSQLDSEGRLFDPLYIQARSNIRCTSDPEKLIFGNFELSKSKEYRYFVRFISSEQGYKIKKIEHFYEIPEEGETLDLQPEFWEH